jgi:peptidoglycan L-alanyl-D-glutamate endopeptidase CwlK
MAMLDDFLNKMKESTSGSGVVGNALGLDQNTAGLLGMAFMNATGNKDMARKMLMMQMLNQSAPPQQSYLEQNYMPQASKYIAPSLNLPQELNPKLASAIPNIMAELRAKGWQPKIASAIRTPEEQAEKVRLGYSQTMNSKHLHGKAVDIVDERYGWNGPTSDTNHQFWKDLGEAAQRQGMQWGGNWKNFKDVAHVQTALMQQEAKKNLGLLNQQTYYA